MDKWIVRTNKTRYPDLFTYDILEANPDAGKSGVCYSGEYLAVASGLDSKENARLMAAAPKMRKALEEILDHFRNNDEAYYKSDLCTDIIQTLNEAEVK